MRWLICTILASTMTAELVVPAPLPERLSDTGLYAHGTRQIAHGVLAFSPQYPLWSDGTNKQRWLYLPPGTAIDASDPDNWVFPAGTRAWKEFGYSRPVETRMIERLADGSWRFATYVWNADGSDAILAPEAGMAYHAVADAPGKRYPIPSQKDCEACHDGGAGPLLGLSALQLSSDRDPLAPHAEARQPDFADLSVLHNLGLLLNLDTKFLQQPPRIPAPTATGRAALGYLHGNCGMCHNDKGPLNDLDFNLWQSVSDSHSSAARALQSTILRDSEPVAPGIDRRIVPGESQHSALIFRLRSRNKVTQMPPLGRRVPDAEAIAVVEYWIEHDLPLEQEYLK